MNTEQHQQQQHILQITTAVCEKQNKKERKPKSTNNLCEKMNISMLKTINY